MKNPKKRLPKAPRKPCRAERKAPARVDDRWRAEQFPTAAEVVEDHVDPDEKDWSKTKLLIGTFALELALLTADRVGSSMHDVLPSLQLDQATLMLAISRLTLAVRPPLESGDTGWRWAIGIALSKCTLAPRRPLDAGRCGSSGSNSK